MAYVVRRPLGRFEIRQSRHTPDGPRARTIASFRTLTPTVVAKALARAEPRITEADVRRAALKAGAPVEPSGADGAASKLLADLAGASSPSLPLRRLLIDALGEADRPPSDAERAVAPWIAASAEERGEALRDLLLLADRLPVSARPAALVFPPFRNSPT
jgi:hypothetical protein